MAQIEEKIGEMLSDFEWKVLCLYLKGKSYQEIAGVLNRRVKSIDNALQRVKTNWKSTWRTRGGFRKSEQAHTKV